MKIKGKSATVNVPDSCLTDKSPKEKAIVEECDRKLREIIKDIYKEEIDIAIKAEQERIIKIIKKTELWMEWFCGRSTDYIDVFDSEESVKELIKEIQKQSKE